MTVMSNYAKNFTIKQNTGKFNPYYNIHVQMDMNDGDYISGDIVYEENEWNKKTDIFFLMLAYLGQGHRGKFSHGKFWDDYYGHHYEENKHGLSDIIFKVAEYENWLQFGEYGECHSFSQIIITYFDEENRKHDVEFKTVDDIFKTEEEMKDTIKEAYKRWVDEELIDEE